MLFTEYAASIVGPVLLVGPVKIRSAPAPGTDAGDVQLEALLNTFPPNPPTQVCACSATALKPAIAVSAAHIRGDTLQLNLFIGRTGWTRCRLPARTWRVPATVYS